eukprot:2678966-Amphidinium_carterae.1
MKGAAMGSKLESICNGARPLWEQYFLVFENFVPSKAQNYSSACATQHCGGNAVSFWARSWLVHHAAMQRKGELPSAQPEFERLRAPAYVSVRLDDLLSHFAGVSRPLLPCRKDSRANGGQHHGAMRHAHLAVKQPYPSHLVVSTLATFLQQCQTVLAKDELESCVVCSNELVLGIIEMIGPNTSTNWDDVIPGLFTS